MAVAALAVAAPTAFPSPGAVGGPTLSARPTVVGTPTEGARLRASQGRWRGSGKIRVAYQWYRCDTMGAHCTILRGATRRTRTIGTHDVGHSIGLQVKATDSKGSTTAYAGLVGPVSGTPPLLAPIRQPVVSGGATPGGTIRIRPGVWKPRPTSVSYQWARCDARSWRCRPIKGATSDHYAVKPGDLGHSLVAIVDARAGSISRAVFSIAAAISAPGAEEASGPANSGLPFVAQGVQVGSPLTGHAGTWSGSGAIKYAYLWYRCDAAGSHCKAIHGATQITYTPTARDAGHTLGLAVAAADQAGTSTAYGGLIGPIARISAPIVSTGQPSIAGTPSQGQTLQVSAGSWSQAPTAVSYQWERCNRNGRICAPIAGATSPTYVTATGDVGAVLVVVVHATLGGSGQDAYSTETAPISAAGPSSTAPPTVSGPAQAGKQLVGTAGTWSGTGTIDYAYQWYRCDSSGAHCKSIHGATKTTYEEVAKDVGQTLAFAVRAGDSVGTSVLYTGIVGPVAAADSPLVATAQPTITGTVQQGQTLQAGGGTWSATPTAVTYQWLRCNANGRLCAPITGATAATYVPTAEDAGHALVVLVQATANGVNQGAISNPTTVVP